MDSPVLETDHTSDSLPEFEDSANMTEQLIAGVREVVTSARP